MKIPDAYSLLPDILNHTFPDLSASSWRIRPVTEDRNNIFSLENILINRTYFIKFQGGILPSPSITHESKVLSLLDGHIDKIPRQIKRILFKQPQIEYIITEKIEGDPLSVQFGKSNNQIKRSVFRELLEWMIELQVCCPDLYEYLDEYHQSIQDLFTDPSRWEEVLQQIDLSEYPFFRKDKIHQYFRHISISQDTPEIIHCDLTQYNIIVKSDSHLAGVIDFESLKRGNLMYDVSRFSLVLLIDYELSDALLWIEACKEFIPEERIRQELPAFFMHICLSRIANAHKFGNSYPVIPSPPTIEAFLKNYL